MNKTKIIRTIGPSTNSYDRLKGLVKAGMNCARLNFSHGSHEEHRDTIRRIREITKDIGIEVAIIQDLPRPKMRIGKVKNNSIYLRKGSMIRLTSEDIIGNEKGIPVAYKDLSRFVKINTDIFLADGSIKLKVVDIKDDIVCIVEIGDKLISGKGINVPELKDDFEVFTDTDKTHLKFGAENDIDLVAVSFVRTDKDD